MYHDFHSDYYLHLHQCVEVTAKPKWLSNSVLLFGVKKGPCRILLYAKESRSTWVALRVKGAYIWHFMKPDCWMKSILQVEESGGVYSGIGGYALPPRIYMK